MAFSLLTGTAGINPGFLSQLEQLRQILPNNLGSQIGIRSGYRSPQHRADLFARAVRKYGSPQAARKWVAPPGRSQHGKGNAVDLSYGSQAAMEAAHKYAPQVGLVFPMSYENWHIEPAGARGGKGGASGGATVNLTGAMPATNGATPAPTPAGTVADILSSATIGGDSGTGGPPSISSGGGPRGTGLIGGDSPPPNTDLQVMPATPQEMSQQPAAADMGAVGPLAGLFSLPTIGLPGDAPPGADALPGALPGQAKPLARKVWL